MIAPRLLNTWNVSPVLLDRMVNSSENGFGETENPAGIEGSGTNVGFMEPAFMPFPKLVTHISLALNGLKNTRSGCRKG